MWMMSRPGDARGAVNALVARGRYRHTDCAGTSRAMIYLGRTE